MNPASQPTPAQATAAPPVDLRPARRRRIAGGVLLVLLLAGAAGYWLQYGRDQVSTEDAYVEGNVVQVTPQVSGVVTAILADNTDLVASGVTLVELNGVDAQLALAAAQAQLARTVRQVRGQFAAVGQDRANVELRTVDLAREQENMTRRSALVASGAISGEELIHARHAVRAAQAALTMASEQLKRNQALVERTSVGSHPDVLAAAAQVRNASIALSRTRILAPVGGVVTKRSVQVGQRVSPGVSMMSVVPLDHLWVTANLKESQLRDIRLGQPVTLTTDLYGRRVVYHGRVIGQDAGTGSAFALLPAQNATGNWIKVVQRVPVRIALDPAEVTAHPLQIGLSMKVAVDTRARDGKRLVAIDASSQNYRTTVFADELARAEAHVRRIIDDNS
ncbi:membrane fusion protein, multidrug efflux system [Cupriavidus sp. OV038]|jgi:membrane fusion protein (multidrug efflux system)|uniref:HlyD family secretion protein n=2 Tax=Pseudomonadota TaxID=1224 RepID=UPI0008ED59AC|nr:MULTISPECIES: efflux RND transporter periplasmic adaptor subunit [unclassified Cupriavidus]SFC62277.1 membrane fusion protein, multidrug efflux system [Cupriavidus sp. OV038]SFP40596.1 membrane fusion protein, multidrug efflux system [Cupriavidus sp. OV096]